MPEVARQFWREVARQTRPILASSRRLPRAIRRLPVVPVWQPPLARPRYVRASTREIGFAGVRSPMGGIRSPFGFTSGSAAKKFAKGKREVLSWCFDDPVADPGSVYINSDANPSLNFASSNAAAILAKFTGWSATSPMIVRGRDGTLKHANHNLQKYANDFSNGIWNTTQLNVTASQSDPYGGSSATLMVTKNGVTINTGLLCSNGSDNGINLAGQSYRFFRRLKASPGNLLPWVEITTTNPVRRSWVNIATGAVGTVNHVSVVSRDLGNGYWEFECETGAQTSGSEIYTTSRSGDNNPSAVTGDGVSGFYVTRAQTQQLPCHSKEYLDTTSAAVYSIPTTYDTSGNKLGFLSWEARTNAAWYSRDLTQSAHVKTNATAYTTAKGTDGIAGSASRLMTTAANGNVIQTITATSAQRVSSAKVRRAKGSGTVKMSQGETTGSELVTNSAFASDVSGWSAISGGTPSWSAGTGRATAGSATGSGMGQGVATTIGKLYRFEFTVASMGTASILDVRMSNSASSGAALGDTYRYVTATGTYVGHFIATATTSYIQLTPRGIGLYADFDNVSVKECTETTLSLTSPTYEEVTGTELVTNGTFGTDTAGWTVLGTATFNSVGGRGVLTVTSGSFFAGQAVTVTPGKVYAVSADFITKSGGSTAYFRAGTSAIGGSEYFTVSPTTDGTNQLQYILATASTLYVTIGVNASGYFSTWDNVSVKEVSPTQLWTEAETAAATITNPCVAIWSNTAGDVIDIDHVQCEVGAKASPPIITAGAAVTRAEVDLKFAASMVNLAATYTMVAWWANVPDAHAKIFCGDDDTLIRKSPGYHAFNADGLDGVVAYVGESTGKGALSVRGGTAKAALNGSLVTMTSGVYGALAITNFHIGRGPSGNHANGIIRRVKLVSTEGLVDGDIQLETAA